jgi:Holliday junction resolvase
MLSNSTIMKGRHAEYAVMKKLESLGFTWIIRSFASYTPIDLLCSNGSERWAVQVKSSRNGAYLSPLQALALREWAAKFDAKPVLARKKRGRWILTQLALEEIVLAVREEAAAKEIGG